VPKASTCSAGGGSARRRGPVGVRAALDAPTTTTTTTTAAPSAPCPTFPANNAWNTDISGYPVHSRSAAWVSSIGSSTKLHPDFGTPGMARRSASRTCTSARARPRCRCASTTTTRATRAVSDPAQRADRRRRVQHRRPPRARGRRLGVQALRALRRLPAGRRRVLGRAARAPSSICVERPPPGRLDVGRRRGAPDLPGPRPLRRGRAGRPDRPRPAVHHQPHAGRLHPPGDP
jgi:hypothetical protein